MLLASNQAQRVFHDATLSLHPTRRRFSLATSATRRKTLEALLGLHTATLATAVCWESLCAGQARAGALSNAWEVMGGGPGDLTFPEEFLGQWTVQSTLVNVELPMGRDAVPDMASVNRAITRDLNQTISYSVAFVRNSSGRVVMDRRINTASLLSMYYPSISMAQLRDMVTWDIDNPNDLSLMLPSGGEVGTRVTRRMEERPDPRKIETSEYLRQVGSADCAAHRCYEVCCNIGSLRSKVFTSAASAASRVKASQCFTKYRWRTADEVAAANSRAPSPDDVAPGIVATQVVSDFLTPNDDASQFARAMGKPVAVMTYKMYFFRS